MNIRFVDYMVYMCRVKDAIWIHDDADVVSLIGRLFDTMARCVIVDMEDGEVVGYVYRYNSGDGVIFDFWISVADLDVIRVGLLMVGMREWA